MDMFPKPQLTLRTLFAFVAVIGIVLAALTSFLRWAKRDAEKIEQFIAIWGMPMVDEIEALEQRHGGVPFSLEQARIAPTLTPYGILRYELYGTYGGTYELSVQLGLDDGYLRWDSLGRRWVTDGRSPYELIWTEAQARELVEARKKMKTP
jgi:hypothetical protein